MVATKRTDNDVDKRGRVEAQKMKVCPKCGFEDDPRWKPYFYHLYWEYADQHEFKELIPPKTERKYCEAGDFYYHFEDQFYYYRLGGKTRKIIYRFPKGRESMVNRKLFEKTPSEKGMDDPFQMKLTNKGVGGERLSLKAESQKVPQHPHPARSKKTTKKHAYKGD